MDIAIVVLKWVLLIFLAGVIGQLGKSLTLKILAMRRAKRERLISGREDAVYPPAALAEGGKGDSRPAPSPAPETGPASAKLEKKRLKAELKDRKKRRKLLEDRNSPESDND